MQLDLTNLQYHINDCYKPFFSCTKRFAVLYGGSGSGKSWAIAQKIIIRLITEDRHNILCVRNTAKSVMKSQFPLLVGTIDNLGLRDLFTINKAQGNEKIICKHNNNQIIFSGLDDVEKLKSIFDITSVWIEEASEISVEDFRELNRRLRGYKGFNKATKTPCYMQFMISFNPISHLCWLKDYFFDNKPKNAYVIKTTYLDNKFLTKVDIEQMLALKEQNEYEYNFYALGMWGVIGGSYFNAEKVAKRIEQIYDKKPIKNGYFDFEYKNEKIVDKSIKWVDNKDGQIAIYEQPKQQYPYVIGGDTASTGEDKFVGQVLDNVTGSQVAVLHGKMDEDLYARQMYCLAKHYNNALVGIETNHSTHPVRELERLGYTFQVLKENVDSNTGQLKKSYGFVTTAKTRPLILSELNAVVRDSVELINDVKTLEEMVTFCRNEKGRPEAQAGKHDDLVMGLAIAHHIRPHHDMHVSKEHVQQVKKLFDKKTGRLRING